MPSDPTDPAVVAATLLEAAKAEAQAALWRAVSEVVADTEDARRALSRVAEDLANVWKLKLQGKDTSVEEKWLEKEAKLVAARLGLQASSATNRAFIATANVLMGIGSALLSALLKIPITLPTIGGGVA